MLCTELAKSADSGYLLKIDQSFINRLLDESDKTSTLDIVEAIVSVSRKKGIETVAEGIESKQVYELLRDLGCDIAQGYAVGRPMAAGDFETWHEEWHFHPDRRLMLGEV